MQLTQGLHAYLQHRLPVDFSLFGLTVDAQCGAVRGQRRFAVHALHSLVCKAHDATDRCGRGSQLNGARVVPCTST